MPGRRPVERVADATEHRAGRALVAQPGLRLLLAADRCQLAQQLLLTGIQARRGVDHHGDHEVAASAPETRHAAAAEGVLAARLGPRLEVELERRLHAAA